MFQNKLFESVTFWART